MLKNMAHQRNCEYFSGTGECTCGATKTTKRLIFEWAEARASASENTRLMLESNFSKLVMEECAKRMKRLNYCELELLSLTQDLPQPLRNYMEARLDKGCASCWLTSSLPAHSECRRKIDRYFQTEEDLFLFAKNFCDFLES